MADETKETGAGAGTGQDKPPVFDPKSIEAMVQGAVKTSIADLVKEAEAKQAEAAAARDAASTQAGKTAQATGLEEMFRPALEPALKAAHEAEMRASMAADSVNFYTDPANAPAMKYRGKIEQIVADQAKRGNVVARSDAWKYLRGGDLYDELSKESLTAHETKIKEAQAAQAAGPSTTVPKFAKPIDDMKTEELGEALKGVTF